MIENFYVKQGSTISLNDDELELIQEFTIKNNISFETIDLKQKLFNLPRSLVGYIKLKNRKIIIQPLNPDIHMNHILRLYFFTYGYNSGNIEENIYELENAKDFEYIISAFIQELISIIKKGLPSSYRVVTRKSNYLIGNIDIIGSYKNLYLKNKEPFICTYDILTQDNPINRILGAALNKISLHINSADIQYLKKYFINANTKIIPHHDNIVFDRKNYYCKKALDLAILILNELFYSDIKGNKTGESFVINYDKLFEDFIKKVLLYYTNDPNFTCWQNKEKYGEYIYLGKVFKKGYIPDILYGCKKDGNSIVADAIIDIKNKTSTIFKNQDVFQMIFYSMVLSSKKLILCYPSVGEQDPVKLSIDTGLLENYSIISLFINITSPTKKDFIKSINTFIENLYSKL